MKPLILALFLFIVSCNERGATVSGGKLVIGSPEVDQQKAAYNVETDSVINELIKTKPVSHRVSGGWYEATFAEIRLTAFNVPHKDFEEEGGWRFYGNYKDGKLLAIHSPLGIPKHMVAPETYERLKVFFLNLK